MQKILEIPILRKSLIEYSFYINFKKSSRKILVYYKIINKNMILIKIDGSYLKYINNFFISINHLFQKHSIQKVQTAVWT